MEKIRFIFIAVLCVLMSGILWSQPRSGRDRAQQMQTRVVFFETIVLPSGSDELTRLDVNYRVMKNFFVFTRSSIAGRESEFEGGYELSIELFDDKGQSRARKIRQERVFNDTPTIEFPDIEYIEGSVSFDLPEGEYRFLIRLNDRNSQRRYVDRDSRISIPSFAQKEPAIYDVFFIEPPAEISSNGAIRPVNLGGNIFFGKEVHGLLVFKIDSDVSPSPEISVRVDRIGNARNTPEKIFSSTISAEAILTGKEFTAGTAGDEIFYSLTDNDNSDFQIAIFPLNGERLEEGPHRIRISMDTSGMTTEHTESFMVHWVDKPASLRNLDFAIEMLEYVTSPEEYRNLRRGSSDERQRKFNEFWKAKNPDPDSAYNPVMDEFYRRVDFAAREFTTIREQNGARTDRGKVYILYGPPTNTDRSLIPGEAPRETWIYAHLNQKFIFVDQSRQGNYRLTTREEL